MERHADVEIHMGIAGVDQLFHASLQDNALREEEEQSGIKDSSGVLGGHRNVSIGAYRREGERGVYLRSSHINVD